MLVDAVGNADREPHVKRLGTPIVCDGFQPLQLISGSKYNGAGISRHGSGKCCLANLVGEIGAFRCPVAESGPNVMHRHACYLHAAKKTKSPGKNPGAFNCV
jgi:hypothetical protein